MRFQSIRLRTAIGLILCNAALAAAQAQGPYQGMPYGGPMMGYPQGGPMMGPPQSPPMMGYPKGGPMMGSPSEGLSRFLEASINDLASNIAFSERGTWTAI